MECPKCHYEPTLSEMQASPGDCVKCGINYEGHARFIEEERARKEAQVETRTADLSSMSPSVRHAIYHHRGAQPVVVVDVNMGFWSMVVFMVKWALASIPALLILLIIIWGFISIPTALSVLFART
jgi:hypothetical protein